MAGEVTAGDMATAIEGRGRPRRRVLFVIDSFGAGGAEQSLVEMLPLLPSLDIDPAVAVLYERAAGVEASVRRLGVPLVALEGSTVLGKIRPFRRCVADLRPHLVHATLLQSSLVARLGSGRATPVLDSLVNTSYDPVRRQDPNVRAASLRAVRAIDGWTARHLSAHFHAITEAVKRHAVETLRIAPERITVIERGRDPARLGQPGAARRHEVRRQLGLADDDEVVLNVGRQEYQKGQDVLVGAIEALAPARPRLVVLVAGREGAATPHLRAMLDRSPARDRIRFLGHRQDVPDLLAAADLFVFPSRYEGLGGSLIEALALGVPIVASDLPALREVVEPNRTGLLVPPGSSAALATCVDELLSDPARRECFSRNARAVFSERFTLARSTERLAELYHRVALDVVRG